MNFHRLLRNVLFVLAASAALCAHAQQKFTDYQLGAGDTIRIIAFQNPDLTLETRVSENGTITYPLLGTLKIGGMTISAAEQTIAKGLREGGYMANPQVNIVLLQNRGNQVSVLGAVNRPGRFPLETFNTRLSEMMAMAGGIASTGADIVILTGTRDGKPLRKEIDIPSLFLDNKVSDDVIVAGGDVIYVHRKPMFYIYGEVQHPGSFRIERGMTIRQALVVGGGLTPRGTERRVALYRRDANGRIQSSSPDLDDPVQADDVLQVRESIF